MTKLFMKKYTIPFNSIISQKRFKLTPSLVELEMKWEYTHDSKIV